MKDKVIQIIVNHLNIDAEKVQTKSSFIEDLGADSLDIVEIVMSFEEEFGIEIPDSDAEKLKTVQNVIDYLEKNVS
ncbi:MAG: acyl carrier protein [Bdellovibrionaceae bacterium]|nr:acyl carrier protein [Pseudobdellovibrionaceae bacterium]